MKRVYVSLLLLVATAAGASRPAIVVSDLHLSGAETVDDAFTTFLREVGPDIDLVLAGDTFELAEDVERSLLKLDHILDRRTALFEELEAVARSGTVHFVPGDRDAHLADGAVAALLKKDVPGATVATGGVWISADRRILVDHGHRLPGSAYGPEVEKLFDALKSRYAILDHFADRLMGLKYGLAAAPDIGPSKHVLKRVLMNVSWQQFRRDLEREVKAPEWDLAAIRATGDRFLLQSFPEDDPLHGVWNRGTRELSDDDLVLLCNQRAAVRRARRRMERGLTQLARVGPVVAECPRIESTRGPSFSYYWSSRDDAYRGHLRTFSTAPDVYVHGHTHLPDRGFAPGPDLDTPRILNAGAFKRTITPAFFEEKRGGGSAAELLERLTLRDLPACYSYVRIDPYETVPEAQQLYWYAGPDGTWGTGRRCEN